MRDWLVGLLELLLPACCAACGESAREALCRRCAARLPAVAPGQCRLCQERTALATRDRCGVCLRRRRPLDACLAGCWYEEEVGRWIRDFKYPHRRGLAATDRARLRALVLETLKHAPAEPPDQVVPVPLHPRRLRGRGFNPAAVIARDLARARALPLRPRALVRVRDTETQTGLGRRDRRRNVRGAFRAREPIPAHIWLVDDVVTTGATLEEAARALRRAGAKRVIALCAARTAASPSSPRSSPR